MSMDTLHDVLVDTVRDLLHAEKQLVKALPKLAKAATDEELQNALTEHLEVTEGQVERLEQVFKELGMTPRAKACAGMAGIVEEGNEVLEKRQESDPASIDAALIAAAQKAEHYEIASYGSACAFANALGLTRVAELLKETLDEEKEADETLTAIAEGMVNGRAAQEGEAEGMEEEEGAASTAGRRRAKPVASGRQNSSRSRQ